MAGQGAGRAGLSPVAADMLYLHNSGPRLERAQFVFVPGSGQPGGTAMDAGNAVFPDPVHPILRMLRVWNTAEYLPAVENAELAEL